MNLCPLRYDHFLPYHEALPLHPSRQQKKTYRPPFARSPRMATSTVYVIRVAEQILDLMNQNDISLVQQFLQKEFPEL